MKKEQTDHVLETEIVARVFPPVAEDNAENSIESSSALKIFVTVINTLLNPDVFLWLSHESYRLKKLNF